MVAGLALVFVLGALVCGRRTAAQTAATVPKTTVPVAVGAAEDGQAAPTPGKPAQITYENGQLTIIAENTPISEILTKLHTLLGVEIDLSAGSTSERMWVRLGPGLPRKIVSDMLSTTELNYVIQGSEQDPDGIQSVSLSPRDKSGGLGATRDPQERAAAYQMPRGNGRADANAEVENPSAAVAPGSAAATPAATKDGAAASGDGNAQTTAAADAVATPDAPDAESSKGSNGRSSAQMIQQLQSMYEQRKQMQQSQPAAASQSQ